MHVTCERLLVWRFTWAFEVRWFERSFAKASSAGSLIFRFRDKDGREQRCRQNARLQSAAGARKEAEQLYTLAIETGSVKPKRDATTFASFVTETFARIYMPRFRPATIERYEALLEQGVLETFGAKRLDAIDAAMLRSLNASLLARPVHPKGPMNFVRTVLRAAVECGALATMPEFPKLPRQGRKLPDAPSTEEVQAMLAHAHGWLRVAVGLAAYAGLRQGEVRALEVRDVDLVGERIVVRHACSGDEVLSPKSGHERVVPLSPALAEISAKRCATSCRRRVWSSTTGDTLRRARSC